MASVELKIAVTNKSYLRLKLAPVRPKIAVFLYQRVGEDHNAFTPQRALNSPGSTTCVAFKSKMHG